MKDELLPDWRLPLILSFVAVAAVFFAGHATGRVYPWMLVSFFAAMASLALLAMKGGSLPGVVSGGVLVAIAFRLQTNYVTTPIGASPQTQPHRFDQILETGTIATGSPFYDDGPLHFTLTTVYAGVSNLAGHEAVFLFAVLVPVTLCAVSICLLRSIGVTDRRALVSVALLALVTTEGIRRSYWVVPQITGAIFWWFALMAFVTHIRRPSKEWYAILVIFAISLAVAHKLPLVFFSIIVVVTLLLVVTDVITWGDGNWHNPIYQLGGLVLTVAAITGFQLLYVGNLFGTAIRRIGRVLAAVDSDEGAESVRDEATGFEGATEALPGIIANYYQYPAEYMLFVERGHGIWLLLAGGAAWAILFVLTRRRAERPQILALLVVAAIGVMLMLLGVIAIGGMNPTRPLLLIEPIIAVLIVGTIWRLNGRSQIREIDLRTPVFSTAATVLIVLLLASQIFAASAAPDYANTPQYYADPAEANAETTFCEYAANEIHVDSQYDTFVGSDLSTCGQFTRFERGPDSDLFNNNVSTERHQSVAFRNNVEVYLGDNDRFYLTWDPAEKLPTEYHTVYENRAVTVFHAPES